MFKVPSKKTIILIILAAAAIGLIVFLDSFTSKANLSRQFQELNDVSLNFSFENLNLSGVSWDNLVPDDLADIQASPEIIINTNILPAEDFDLAVPSVNLQPPLVSANNVAEIVSAECAQFQYTSSCAAIGDLQDKALCEQCQKGKK